MLVNAYNFLAMFRAYKTLWLAGRVGSGKTLLSFAVARELVEGGHARYIVSNIPSVWTDEPDFVLQHVRDIQYTDTVFILDEGGQFIRSGNDADRFVAFLRKFNNYVIISSVKPPASDLRQFSAYRTIDWGIFGLPLWQFSATLNFGQSSGITERNRERFFLWRPSRYFGIYDTEAAPLDDGAIAEMVTTHIEKVALYNEKSTVRSKHASRPRLVPSVEGFGGGAELIEEAAATISEAVSLSLGQERAGNKRGRR